VTTAQGPADRFASALGAALDAWSSPDPDQRVLRAAYRRFLAASGAAAVDRDLGRAHVTGSAFVFTPDLERVVLCFHRKADAWLQLGGHVEPGDASAQDTAYREAREESGLTGLAPIGAGPLDLDRHALGPGFTRCDTHWDVGYGFVAEGEPVASDESAAVRWWPVDALPDAAHPDLVRRLRRAARLARAAR